MKINICIPTLNRYDLLPGLINSLENNTIKPEYYIIFDNGGKLTLEQLPPLNNIKLILAPSNIGVAKSWNFFIENVPEIRLIINDDLIFPSTILEDFLTNYDDTTINYPVGVNSINMFSCFIIPDKLVEKVGNFDIDISPNYAYYEDNDYAYRLKLLGIEPHAINSDMIEHLGSATLKAMTKEQTEEHHRRFNIAKRNYLFKWGGLPGKEIYKVPYGVYK